MNTLKKHFKIWWKLTQYTSQVAFASRFGAVVFIVGKIIRFAFFLLFIVLIVSKTHALVGYSLWQVIFFYATFNLVDTLPQFFLREVYRFRWQVVSGMFDTTLAKPISPLFRALLGGSDIFDLSILSLSILFIIISVMHIGEATLFGTILYILLVVNAFIIALSLHICVAALGILTTEVDNAIMMYRDVTQMGRFPIDIYKEPIRGLLTFAIPVGIMMSFPAKALMGALSWQFIVLAFWMGILLLFLAYEFWKYSLRHYSSASS